MEVVGILYQLVTGLRRLNRGSDTMNPADGERIQYMQRPPSWGESRSAVAPTQALTRHEQGVVRRRRRALGLQRFVVAQQVLSL